MNNHKGDIYYCAENISTFNYTTNQGFEHCALCNKSSRNHYNIQHFKCPSITCTQILPQERVSKWFPSSSFLSQPAMENSPKNSAPIFLQKLSSHISSILDPIIFQYLF
uniref:Uncharacterized protein n=1 Tax=Manihot esculenta TaxID=3983 RepID=A0A2C9W8R1_MANES